MKQHLTPPDLGSRQKAIEQLRESNRRLELLALTLDEAIATIESELRHQRRQRLESATPTQAEFRAGPSAS